MTTALTRHARLLRRAAMCGLAYFAVLLAAGVAREGNSRERGEEAVHSATEHVVALLSFAGTGDDGPDGPPSLPAARVVLTSVPADDPVPCHAGTDAPRPPARSRASARAPPILG
jgi:hypothetical protein